MRPPPLTGDDQPPPGIVCFQATFFVVLHSVGRPPFSTRPCPVGPRNSGQEASGARGLGASATDTAQASKQQFMRQLTRRGGQVGQPAEQRHSKRKRGQRTEDRK